MASTTVTIGSASGLHSRPAATFVRAAGASGAAVTLQRADGASANGASLLAIISLGVKYGDQVTLSVEGGADTEILAELSDLLASDLDAA